jgi:hypothetical protein
LFLYAPVSIVADAAGLANDQVGSGKKTIDAMEAFFLSAIMMQETATTLFDDLAIAVDRTSPAADAKNAFAAEIGACATWRSIRACGPTLAFGLQVVDGFFGMFGQQLQAVDFPAQFAGLRRQRAGFGFGIIGAAGQGRRSFSSGRLCRSASICPNRLAA